MPLQRRSLLRNCIGRGTFFKEVLSRHTTCDAGARAQSEQVLGTFRRLGKCSRHVTGGIPGGTDLRCPHVRNGRAGKGHMALLAVSLEQASVDGARMELGFQLTWLEEPPGSMYLPRTKGLARGRSFAPLASQRWVTFVLAYLRKFGHHPRRHRPMPTSSSAARRGPSSPEPPPHKAPHEYSQASSGQARLACEWPAAYGEQPVREQPELEEPDRIQNPRRRAKKMVPAEPTATPIRKHRSRGMERGVQ